jgi:4-amino-4-deoxy-L-arabinose transferase-like glycosyltransferase
MNRPVSASRLALGAILAVALALRLYQIGFGLPGLYDPDEPLFMVMGAGLLTRGTLNPHWFGHPGSTTIYLTALIQALVFLTGWLSGRFATVADFVHAAYADPAIVFVPVRVAMALLGTACVGLTYALGKRLYGPPVGLLAALLLALNSLHIAWSQVVRTDVQASVFMLGALVVACRLVETGSRKHAIWAGLLTGFAIATKWPAISVFAGIIGASFSAGIGWRSAARLILVAGLASLVGLFIASPFIFIDYPTVLSNLAGEGRAFHVGHTGGGALSNLATYLTVFARDSIGWVGLTLAGLGFVVACVQRGPARAILVPATILFFAGICAQHLIWSRWLVPGLPYLVLFGAAAVFELASLATMPKVRTAMIVAGGGFAVLASAAGPVRQATQPQRDTTDETAR